MQSASLGEGEYSSEVLAEDHKEIVMDMISRSFADKGDLTTLANVNYDHIKDQMEVLWHSILAANLSLVVRDSAGQLIGSCINFDARSEEAEPLCATSAFSRAMTDEERREERKKRRRDREAEDEPVPSTQLPRCPQDELTILSTTAFSLYLRCASSKLQLLL